MTPNWRYLTCSSAGQKRDSLGHIPSAQNVSQQSKGWNVNTGTTWTNPKAVVLRIGSESWNVVYTMTYFIPHFRTK